MAANLSDIGKLGGFLAGLAAIITVIITIDKSCDNPKLEPTPAETKNSLTICELVDSITHEQKRRFKNIKRESFYVGKDAEVRYRSTLNLSADSSVIFFRNKDNKCFYRGYFISETDSITALRIFYNRKSDIKICLYDWSDIDLIDSERNFPFTRYTKNNTQIELFLMRNSIDKYTVGLVVEDWE